MLSLSLPLALALLLPLLQGFIPVFNQYGFLLHPSLSPSLLLSLSLPLSFSLSLPLALALLLPLLQGFIPVFNQYVFLLHPSLSPSLLLSLSLPLSFSLSLFFVFVSYSGPLDTGGCDMDAFISHVP